MGAQAPSDKMIRWVRAQLSELTEKGPVTRFEVFHKTPGDEPERVWRYNVNEKEDSDSIAFAAWEAAKDNAEGYLVDGRPQQYVLASYRGEDDELDLYFAFPIKDNSLKFAFEGTEGAANEGGMIAQVLRHSENNHKLMMGMMQSTAGHLIEEAENLRRANKRLEETIAEQNKLHQDNLDRQLEREQRAAEFEATQQRKNQLMKLFMGAAPLAMAKLASGKPAPSLPAAAAGPSAAAASAPAQPQAPASNVVQEQLAAFAAGLTMDEMQAVLGQLNPENAAKLVKLYETALSGPPTEPPTPERNPDNGTKQEAGSDVRAGTPEGSAEAGPSESEGQREGEQAAQERRQGARGSRAVPQERQAAGRKAPVKGSRASKASGEVRETRAPRSRSRVHQDPGDVPQGRRRRS
jgi:hypothetical protein